MPTSVGFASWAALGAAAAATAAQIVIATVISHVISSVFAKKPQSNNLRDQDRLHSIRQPAAAGRVIFGRIRVGGVPVFIHSSTFSSSTTGPVTEDHVIPVLSPSVRVTLGRSVVSVLSVVSREYDPPSESYFDVLFTQASGTTFAGQGQYFVDGSGLGFNGADASKAIRVTYEAVLSTTVSKYTHIVLELACHECDAIENIYFDNELIPIGANGYADGRLSGGWAYVSKHLGTADQLADESLIAYAPDKWTTAHRLRGRTYIYVRLLRDIDKFPNGFPNITADVRGYKPYDPRTGLSVWSNTWALCIAGYLTNTSFGLKHVYADEIDSTLLIAAANVSDELVALNGGGTEKRYACNGSFLTSEQPKEILGRMKVAGAGHIVRIGGKWKIYAGAYLTPTVTLNEDSLRGPVHIIPRLSKREAFNGVKGVYISEDNAWQPADFPVVKNATYLAEDQNEPIDLDMDLQYTTSSGTAQRLAKLELERVRQQITVTLPCKLSAWTVEPPRTVMLTLAQFGWVAKPFEVVQVDLVTDQDDQGNPYMGVDHTLRETAASVYDWNSGEETIVDPAPDTNLPNPFDVAPPGVPSAREELYEALDGVRVRAIIEWAASSDGQADTYDHEYKLITDLQWTQHGGLSTLRDTIEDIAPGTYDSRVRARVRLTGKPSAWAQVRYTITGLLSAPVTPVIAGLQAIGGMALLSLDPHPDLDVRRGGRFLVRHTEATASQLWEESFSIGDERGYPGGANIIVLPLKAGSYLIKAEDQGGRQSSGFAAIPTKQASIHTFTTIATVTESTTFPGTHSGTIASGGILKLDAFGLFDSIADFDAVTSLDAFGGVYLSGTYTFSTGFDFGSVLNRRLTGHIDGIVINEFELIDSRESNIDDWLDFDGAGGGGVTDAWLEYRQTDQDPAGSPTWTDWRRLDAAEVAARGVQCRLQIITTDPAYNQHVDTLSVVAHSV